MLNTRSEKNRPTRQQPGEAIERAWGAISEGGAEILDERKPMNMNIKTLAQATTDGLTALALTVARQTDKTNTHALLVRYQSALAGTGQNSAGAQLVGEMARVVSEIKD